MWLKSRIKEYLNDPQVTIFLLISLFIVLLFYFLGQYLVPVFASIVLSYVLEGLIRPLERLKVPRSLAVFLVFMVFMSLSIFLLLWIIPLAIKQFGQFIQDLPSMITSGKAHLERFIQSYPKIVKNLQIDAVVSIFIGQIREMGKNFLTYSLSSVMGLVNFLIYLVLVPLISFFFLKDKEYILSFIKGLLPDNIEFTSQVWREVNAKIARFLQGKIWELLIVWLASYIFFFIIHLKFALLLSLFVGISVLIPFVGAIAMTVPVVLVAYFQWGWSDKTLSTLIGYTILQFLDGNLLVPLLMSGFVNLHPVAIMIGVLIFGGLWGLWGVFFAIPLLTLLHTIIKTWPRKKIKEEEDEG